MTAALRMHRLAQAFLVLAFLAFPVSVSLANVALLITLVLWLCGLPAAPARDALARAMRNPLVAPGLALFGWILVALLWSPADRAGMAGFVQKYLKLAMLPVFIALLQDAGVRRRSWQAFGLALLFTLVLTWLNVWFDFAFTRTHNQGFGVDHTVFKDYIAQGVMMSFFAVLCAACALRGGKRAWLFGLVWLLASASILVLSEGRTGYLAWSLSTVVFSVTMAAAHSRRMVPGVLLALGVLFAAAMGLSSQLQSRGEQALQEAFNSDAGQITSIGSRLRIAEFVLARVPEAPLLGHGTAAYPVHAAAHFTAPGQCAVVCPHPHNQFLFFLFEQGAIGLLLFMWFIVAIAREAWRHAPRVRASALALVAILCAACVSHSSLWLSTESHFFMLMTALLMAELQARRGRAPGPGGH